MCCSRCTFDARDGGAQPRRISCDDVLVEGLGVARRGGGPDFEFGKGRAGNLADLAYMGEMEGFSVTVFDMVTASGDDKISSTRIREALKAAQARGSRAPAGPLLGGGGAGRAWRRARPHDGLSHRQHASGSLPGAGLRRLCGARHHHGNDRAVARHDGVANFGIRPMYQIEVPLMETHLFDFDGDLYGKHLIGRADLLYPPRSEVRRPCPP